MLHCKRKIKIEEYEALCPKCKGNEYLKSLDGCAIFGCNTCKCRGKN